MRIKTLAAAGLIAIMTTGSANASVLSLKFGGESISVGKSLTSKIAGTGITVGNVLTIGAVFYVLNCAFTHGKHPIACAKI